MTTTNSMTMRWTRREVKEQEKRADGCSDGDRAMNSADTNAQLNWNSMDLDVRQSDEDRLIGRFSPFDLLSTSVERLLIPAVVAVVDESVRFFSSRRRSNGFFVD